MTPAKGTRRYGNPLQVIPGVGPSIAQDLNDLGVVEPADLIGRDPQQLYQQLMELRGSYIDRCVLYVFRCAVYFSETARPDPDLLQWWRWKDRGPRPAGT